MTSLDKKTEWIVSFVAVLIQIIVILMLANDLLLPLVIVLFGIVLFSYTIFSVEKIFYLLAFYVAAFEVRGYLTYFPGMTIWYSWKISYPLFMVLITYWIIHLSRHKESFKWNAMDCSILIFLIIMTISAVHGFFRGYNRMLLFYDYLPVPFFLGYFIFLYSPLRKRIRVYYDVLLAITVFVCLQFVYAITKFKAEFILTRIVSEHIHIAQFAVPYIIATLIYAESKKRRILHAAILPIVLLGVLLCQQRSLYASIALTSLSILAIYIYSKRDIIRRNVSRFFWYFLAFTLLLICFFVVLQFLTRGKFMTTISSRLFIFLNLDKLSQDISWQIRWREIEDALGPWGIHYIFGKGFGANFVTRCRYMVAIVVDQSYAYFIWKTGIIGLASALFMHIVLFKRGIQTLAKKISNDDRILLSAAIFNTAGMMLVAFANVSIAHFRLMFVWAGLFAVVEAIARKYE